MQSRMKEQPIVRVVVVGGSYAGVELSCNLATELGGKGVGNVEVSLASNSEVWTRAGSCSPFKESANSCPMMILLR